MKTIQRITRSLAAAALIFLSACSKGGDGKASDLCRLPGDVNDELVRLAQTYQIYQRILDVIANVEPGLLQARSGQSLSCASGGSVSYGLSVPSDPNADSIGSVQFSHCMAPLGEYNGELDFVWQQANQIAGEFDAEVHGNLQAGDTIYGLQPAIYSYQKNNSSGLVTVSFQPDFTTSVSPPLGQTLHPQTPHVTIEYTAGVSPAFLSDVEFDLVDPNTANGIALRQPGSFPVGLGVGDVQSIGLGLPSGGGLDYSRVDQPWVYFGPATFSDGTVQLDLKYSADPSNCAASSASAAWTTSGESITLVP